MTIWADEMILQYKGHLSELKAKRTKLDKNDPMDKLDLTQYNSMIEEMEFVLKWLETGRDPNNYRGADKKGIYQHRSFHSMDFILDITEQLEEGPNHLYMSVEEKVILADIFASLSFRERHCYILHVGRQISAGKIAVGLGVGVGKSTAQSYIERARKKVAQRVS